MSAENLPDTYDDRWLQQAIDGCELAHRRLRVTIGRLDDDEVRAPSRLRGWTVGHVLTHLARNAEGHSRILEGAMVGEHRQQYAGGMESRNADIEAGADRSAQQLVDDVVDTFVRLERIWAEMGPEAWDGYGYSGDQMRPCRQLPFYRWREVEVHHVDLGVGYEPQDWPQAYVDVELPAALRSVTARLPDRSSQASVLAWLIGRGERPDQVQLRPWLERPDDYRIDG